MAPSLSILVHCACASVVTDYEKVLRSCCLHAAAATGRDGMFVMSSQCHRDKRKYFFVFFFFFFGLGTCEHALPCGQMAPLGQLVLNLAAANRKRPNNFSLTPERSSICVALIY